MVISPKNAKKTDTFMGKLLELKEKWVVGILRDILILSSLVTDGKIFWQSCNTDAFDGRIFRKCYKKRSYSYL